MDLLRLELRPSRVEGIPADAQIVGCSLENGKIEFIVGSREFTPMADDATEHEELKVIYYSRPLIKH